MSDELNAVEKVVEEVLIDLMDERVMSERRMSTGVQASSTGGVQASPSTSCEQDLPEPRPRQEQSTKMILQTPS
jgi:hypothetical protein